MDNTNARPKVAVIGFSQESNSFTGLSTGLAEFYGQSGHAYEGPEVRERLRGTNTVTWGLIETLEQAGFEAVPVLDAYATPGGPLTAQAYDTLRQKILGGVTACGTLAGVALSLHGAMIAGEVDDPEGDLLAALRRLVGEAPIAAVLDLHANVTPRMVRAASVLIAYKTYPHVDLAASGRKAAGLLAAAIRTGHPPVSAFIPLPMLLPSINMRTNDGVGPMFDLQEARATLEAARPDVLEIGIYGGFPFADVSFGSASVLVYANDQISADSAALAMADRYWSSRHEFIGSTESAAAALALARNEKSRPTVLADVADNPASGGSGDTTTLLRLIVDADVPNSFVGVLFDSDSVARAVEIGVGNEGEFELGGKVAPAFGPPVVTRAKVVTLASGDYLRRGPMLRGSPGSIGRAALLRVGKVEVAVAEARASVNDPAMLEILGVDWRHKDLLALKVKGHFRAAFGEHVGRIINAEAPGAAPTALDAVAYQHVMRPRFPLDEVEWEPTVDDGANSR